MNSKWLIHEFLIYGTQVFNLQYYNFLQLELFWHDRYEKARPTNNDGLIIHSKCFSISELARITHIIHHITSYSLPNWKNFTMCEKKLMASIMQQIARLLIC